jgi:hypothetical protein
MASQPIPSESAWNDLVHQVDELHRRIGILEARLAAAPAEVVPAPEPDLLPDDHPLAPSLAETTGALPVLGTALLGVAGAYLLRALTEYGTLPRAWGVAAGIAYALVWLFLAARTSAERRLQVALYGLTSVLILAPMLWETTVRYQAIPPWAAAAVLTGFSAYGLGVSWRKSIASVAWITTLAGVATCLILLVATRDVAPFAIALIAIGAAVEFSACWDHWLGERWVVALAADLSVLFLTYLITRENGLPEGYAPLSALGVLLVQSALLVVYLGSTIVRTLLRDLDFTFFETTQTAVAFTIALGGALRIAAGRPAAAAAIGTFALLGGVACYVVAFAFLERRHAANSRNLYTYSSFALLLVLAGGRLLLSGLPLALVGSALALVCLWAGGKSRRTTVRWHGAFYLLLTALASGLLAQSSAALFGLDAGTAPFTFAALICYFAAVAAYAIAAAKKPHAEWHWTDRLPDLLAAAIVVWGMAGIGAGLLLYFWGIAAGAPAGGAPAATLRTAIITSLAAGMAWAGRRWQRPELLWLVAPLLVLGAYKMVTEDLQQGHMLALFLSLLCYGGVLVLLPRILQKSKAA